MTALRIYKYLVGVSSHRAFHLTGIRRSICTFVTNAFREAAYYDQNNMREKKSAREVKDTSAVQGHAGYSGVE